MSTAQRTLWTTLTTLVVLAGVGLPFLLREHADARAESAPVDTTALHDERHYYVLLSVVEVKPARGADESSWDIDGSAPDLYYEIHWQGHRVFQSTKKSDTLVAKWSNVAVDLGDLVRSVSLDESMQAARITARASDEVEFIVYDADVGGDDVAGRWKVAVKDLAVGDQRWAEPGGDLVSAECRVLPLDDVDFKSLTK